MTISTWTRSAASLALAAAMATAMTGPSSPAAAEDWPMQPVHIIVPNGPGGGTDIVSRIVGEALSKELGQPFVIENRPGAGTTIGTGLVARAEKDGHTALMMSNAFAVSAATYKSLPYDPLKDFQMVSLVGTVALTLVTAPDFPAQDLGALIAAAKAEPGKYNFASVGVGTTQHFAGELFRIMAGIKVTHVPYTTTPAVIAGLLSNEVQMSFELIPAVQGQVADGGLKALAVTSPERFPTMADIPTIAEGGVADYNVTSWYGLSLPTGTPAPIVDKLNAAMVKVLAQEDVRKQILNTGIVVRSSTVAELETHVTGEIAKWRNLMKQAGIPQQ